MELEIVGGEGPEHRAGFDELLALGLVVLELPEADRREISWIEG